MSATEVVYRVEEMPAGDVRWARRQVQPGESAPMPRDVLAERRVHLSAAPSASTDVDPDAATALHPSR